MLIAVVAVAATALVALAVALVATRRRATVAESSARALATEAEAAREREAASQREAERTAAELAERESLLHAARSELALARRTADVLWALELARSEQRWRVSVAPGVHLDSPFKTSPNPLATAVEVEAAALHDEVGTTFTIRWEVGWPLAPGAALVALRLCQETLAACAKAAETVELSAEADGGDLVVAVTAEDTSGGAMVPVLPDLGEEPVRWDDGRLRIRGALAADPEGAGGANPTSRGATR